MRPRTVSARSETAVQAAIYAEAGKAEFNDRDLRTRNDRGSLQRTALTKTVLRFKDRNKEEDTSRHKVSHHDYPDAVAHSKALVDAGNPGGADAVIHRGNRQPMSTMPWGCREIRRGNVSWVAVCRTWPALGAPVIRDY